MAYWRVCPCTFCTCNDIIQCFEGRKKKLIFHSLFPTFIFRFEQFFLQGKKIIAFAIFFFFALRLCKRFSIRVETKSLYIYRDTNKYILSVRRTVTFLFQIYPRSNLPPFIRFLCMHFPTSSSSYFSFICFSVILENGKREHNA